MPSAVRPVFWVLRALGVILAAGAVFIAALAFDQGVWWLGLFAIAAGVAMVALTWMHPLSKWMVPTMIAVGVLVIVAARSWPVTLIVAANAIIIWWSRRPGRARVGRLNPDNVVIGPPDAVMKNARTFVAEFTQAGFEQVGALQFSIGPFKVIASLLLSGNGHSYASVTDSSMSITSLFPDGRSLVTLNNNLVQLDVSTLLNEVAGGSPAELVESHTGALVVVAERDHYPLSVAATELPQIAADRERAAIVWAAAHGQGPKDAGPLSSREDLDERIAVWHGAAEG